MAIRLEPIMLKNLPIILNLFPHHHPLFLYYSFNFIMSLIITYKTVSLCKLNFTLAETSEIQVIQQDTVGEGELHHPDGCTH